MPQQLRLLIAVALSLFIFYAWSTWVAPPQKPLAPPAATTAGTLPSPGNPPMAKASPLPAGPTIKDRQSTLPEQRTTVTTDLLTVEFSNIGGIPRGWGLAKYVITNGTEHPVDLITTREVGPLQLSGDLLKMRLPNDVHYTVDQPNPMTLVYRWRGNGIEVVKTYTFHTGSYVVDLTVAITNVTTEPLQGSIGLSWGETNLQSPRGGFLSFLHGPPDVWSGIYYKDGKVARVRVGNSVLEERQSGRVYWAGVENRYYLAAILPRGEAAESHVIVAGQPGATKGASEVSTEYVATPVVIPVGQTTTESFSVYAGPKKLEELKAVGLHLDEAIDYGWFGFAAIPILYLLKFFYQLVHNYGVAIILMTLFIKLLLHPVTKASMRSMRKMQTLQPRLKELREKYKTDRERLNMETMQLFRSHGVNPMGGCLPMVLQLPIYIALYKVLWNAIELYQAPFFAFYRDLSAPDPYFITPFLLGIAFFLQQRLTPLPSADPAQQKIMMIMPVMFTAFMVFLPSGLVIYILVNTLFSVLQQWLMNRGLGFRDLLRGQLKPRLL